MDEQTLYQQFADSTMIVIAHRLKTIERCDRVLVFHEGQIAESGPPGQLLADPTSRYYAFSNDHQDESRN
jgi:ABC-type multidrug transport system fused ATPase/permease subunit